MDSLYYTQYNDDISLREMAFRKDDMYSYAYSYAYSSSYIDHYISDDIRIEFNGKDCCQVSNITAIPTIDNITNINVNTQKNVNEIVECNDINYNDANLAQQLQTKNALQFSSLAIDTYLSQSNYIFNYVANKIVSIRDTDFRLNALNTVLANLLRFNPGQSNIPRSIDVKCLYNDEYIWRSDESLTHIYNLPMLLVKVKLNYNYTVTSLQFVHSYNNFTYNSDEITIYNYDENSNFTGSRIYLIKDIKKLITNEYNDYLRDCIPNVSLSKFYYFYLVNLTNEFIHFEDITEYNFYSEATLKQYTLVVFNESMTNKKLLSQDETTQQFVNAWKMKNHKKTVDDIKKIVEDIKVEYNKCSESLLNL